MADPYIGEIKMFAGNFAPQGFALCNGQLMSISQNTALFSILGTTYGGNGTTNFALPDLQGRVPMHMGGGPGLQYRPLGESAGQESVTLQQSQMPPHTHGVNCDKAGTGTGGGTFGSQTGNGVTPQGHIPGLATDPSHAVYSNQAPNGVMNPAMIAVTGGGQSHENHQPYLCVTFIIALFGIYPARS